MSEIDVSKLNQKTLDIIEDYVKSLIKGKKNYYDDISRKRGFEVIEFLVRNYKCIDMLEKDIESNREYDQVNMRSLEKLVREHTQNVTSQKDEQIKFLKTNIKAYESAFKIEKSVLENMPHVDSYGEYTY